ncbi:MAG: 4'-phosphopantetheinyl transferase superfamily protein [Pseudomonadota bacterium]|nr:4'-phosphopantetheinyl transferase superfamily protein [Pseudomonadota bacterium]
MTVAWAHDPGELGAVAPEDLAAFARRSPAARFASLAARCCLRRLLADALGLGSVRIGRTAMGAPFLPEHPEVWVSLAHAPGCVAAAVSTAGPVGIDVEPNAPRFDPAELHARVLHPDERSEVTRHADPVRRFFELWTAKEAVAKALGLGLAIDFRRLRVLDAEGVRALPVPAGFAGALALRSPP